ncbi:MAG TPA: glycosyltransferase family 9 protein [Thermoguttaceae bacterium]|nr:glycosyltransferase family 9 protein [Thermoguttaceae bacterium]
MPRLRKQPLGRYRYVRLRWRVAFAVIDFVGSAVFALAAAVRRLLGGRERATRRDPRTILLVQLDHLGDSIITTSILPALRSRYPEASIEVLAGAWNREVFEACPEVDRVYVSQVNRFARGGLRRIAWIPATFWWGLRLRLRRKVDLGIDVRGEFPLALILWLCGARRRVGWDCGGGGFLLTDRADFVRGRPEVLSRWALLEQLGIRRPEEFDAWQPRFPRRLPETAARSRAGVPLVVLHVGAGTEAKQWPASHWRELLGRILVGRDARVVLVGGKKDRSIARRILGGRRWPGVVDQTGRLSIAELAGLLERADVLVGADSGPAHLAAAVDTPVVVLFSGTNDPRQWQPCGRQVVVVRHEVDCSPCHRERCPVSGHPCMSRLDPERVAAEVERVLRSNSCARARMFDATSRENTV